MIPFADILTAELPRSRRRVDLHTRAAIQPVGVRCTPVERDEVESVLRVAGVRIVDCWGAIIAPTLADFEDELAREPVPVRQSSDNA